MIIYGYEVPPAVEKAALATMVGKFAAKDIEAAAIAAGAPKMVQYGKPWQREYCASRIVDRLLQQERKTGKIRFDGNKWIRI